VKKLLSPKMRSDTSTLSDVPRRDDQAQLTEHAISQIFAFKWGYLSLTHSFSVA